MCQPACHEIVWGGYKFKILKQPWLQLLLSTCNTQPKWDTVLHSLLVWGGGVILATIFRLHPGKAGQNTTLQNPLAYAVDSSEIQTPQHTSCSHLNTSKIVLQKILTKSYKYRKSTESTDMRTIRQSTVSNPIKGTYIYIYILVIYFDRAILRFLGLQHGFRQPDFWWEETCVENKAPKSTLDHGTHGCNSICPYLSSSDWHESNITKWSRVAGYVHDIIIMYIESHVFNMFCCSLLALQCKFT